MVSFKSLTFIRSLTFSRIQQASAKLLIPRRMLLAMTCKRSIPMEHTKAKRIASSQRITALSSSPMAYKEGLLDLIWTWRTSIPCKSPTRQRQKSKRQYLSNMDNGKYLLRVQMEKGLGDTSPKSKWTRPRFARKLNPSLSRKGRNFASNCKVCLDQHAPTFLVWPRNGSPDGNKIVQRPNCPTLGLYLGNKRHFDTI